MITAEILAHANWLILIVSKWTDTWTKFIIYVMRQRVIANNLTVCYRKKRNGISFSWVCLVIDNKFHPNIVNESSLQSSTATLTML